MINAKFTYLKLSDTRQDFGLAEWYIEVLKAQYESKSQLAEFSSDFIGNIGFNTK